MNYFLSNVRGISSFVGTAEFTAARPPNSMVGRPGGPMDEAPPPYSLEDAAADVGSSRPGQTAQPHEAIVPLQRPTAAPRREVVVGPSSFDLQRSAELMAESGFSYVGHRRSGHFNQIMTFEKLPNRLSILTGFGPHNLSKEIEKKLQQGWLFVDANDTDSFFQRITFDRPIADKSAGKKQCLVGSSTFDLQRAARSMDARGLSYVCHEKVGPFYQIVTFEKPQNMLHVIVDFSFHEQERTLTAKGREGWSFVGSQAIDSFLTKFTFTRSQQ